MDAKNAIEVREQLARSVGDIVNMTHSFADSEGKYILWTTFLAIVSPVGNFLRIAQQQCLLSARVFSFKCAYGVVAYTARYMQVNVNIVVPVDASSVQNLMDLFAALIFKTGSYTINAMPLKTHIRDLSSMNATHDLLHLRSFVSDARTDICNMTYCAEKRLVSLYGMDFAVSSVVLSIQDVGNAKPLTTAKANDDASLLYWHKFGDNIVVLPNARFRLHEPIEIPSTDVICMELIEDPFMKSFIENFEIGAHTSPEEARAKCMNIVGNEGIPLQMQISIICFVCKRYGITDDTIMLVGSIFVDDMSVRNDFVIVDTMCCVYTSMAQLREKGFVDDTVLTLMVAQACTRVEWRVYLETSHFMTMLVAGISFEALRRFTKSSPGVCANADARLSASIGKWSKKDEVAAGLLIERHAASPKVECEFQRLVTSSYDAAMTLTREDAYALDDRQSCSRNDGPTMVKKKKKKKKKKKNMNKNGGAADDDDDDGNPADDDIASCASADTATSIASIASGLSSDDEPCGTYDALCDELQIWLGFPCSLIGSGIFFQGSDMDVVVRVPSTIPSLKEAYDVVRAKTSWLLTRPPSGTAVVSLKGCYRGVTVDAQVWRGCDAPTFTKAESLTKEAVDFSVRLRREVDPTTAECIRILHRWSEAAGVKSNRLCSLSGIAVTALAIVFHSDIASDSRAQLAHMLERLRIMLSTSHPVVDIDLPTVCNGPSSICDSPLRVIVQGRNVTARMTTATTRYLLSCVTFALRSEDPLNAASYDAWQRATMVPILRLRPADNCDISMTLNTNAAKIDGHPCVASINFKEHLAQEEEKDEEKKLHVERRHIVVWVDASTTADAGIYGFRDSDRIEASPQSGKVVVFRKHRSWDVNLYAVSASRSVTWEQRKHVGDMVQVQGGVVLNAPYLEQDLCAHFTSWVSAS